MNIRQAYIDRDAALARATTISEAAEAANRDLTDEERVDYDASMTEAVAIRNRIARHDAMAIEQGLTPSTDAPSDDPNIGMDKPELRAYSLIRAINASITLEALKTSRILIPLYSTDT